MSAARDRNFFKVEGNLGTSSYIPALDGLRAVSIILVMLSHFGLRAVPGLFGVTVFFFISGFLITQQLLQEIGRTGTIQLGLFYIRRLLRLYPALIVAVACGAGAYAALGGNLTMMDLLSAIFYFANYNDWFGGNQSTLQNASHPFTVLWSLAVEEHYYVVFPLLMLLCARSKSALISVVVVAIIIVGCWRADVAWTCHQDPSGCVGLAQLRIEHGTDTRADSILYGALLAVLLASSHRQRLLALIRSHASFAIGIAMLLVGFVIRDSLFRDSIRYCIQGGGLFLCIGGLLFSERLALLRRAVSWHWLIMVGRWSYSLYLWHWIVRMVAGAFLPTRLWMPVLDPWIPPVYWLVTVLPLLFLCSFAAAVLSYTYVERPMLVLRRRFGSQVIADSDAFASEVTMVG